MRDRASLNERLALFRKDGLIGDKLVTDKPDDRSPGDHGHASLPSHSSETSGSHLAHWPPRLRGHEHKPVHVKLHQAVEPTVQAKSHGLGLTRSAFADDSE
jgi:hypothetical protein